MPEWQSWNFALEDMIVTLPDDRASCWGLNLLENRMEESGPDERTHGLGHDHAPRALGPFWEWFAGDNGHASKTLHCVAFIRCALRDC